VSGKGLTHAQILVMAEIFDKIRTRIATDARRKWRLLLVPAVCAGMVVAFGPTPGASATPKPFSGNDHPTQTTGTAVRYGASAPPRHMPPRRGIPG
jgi:hypothetical protein